MNNKTKTRSLKVAIIAVALLLCLALTIGITSAWYQARRQAQGIVVFDQGIKFTITEVQDDTEDHRGPYQLQHYSNKVVDNSTGNKIVLDATAVPGEVFYVANPTINPASDTVPFALRSRLTYIFKDVNGQELSVDSLKARKALFQTLYDGNAAIDFDENWLYDITTDYFYYVNSEANGLRISNIAKITGETAPFTVFANNLSGATKMQLNEDFGNVEAGGPVVDGNEIRSVEIVLDLEFLQYNTDSIKDVWGDSSIVVDENGVLTSATGFLVDEVVVPEVVDGKTVKQIGYGDVSATIDAPSLVLPQTVAKIAAFSFPKTSNDMTIRFDSSDTLSSNSSFKVSTYDGELVYDLSIGAGAFSGCPNLVIRIPSGKTYRIADNAFDDTAQILYGDSGVAKKWSGIKYDAASYGITLFTPSVGTGHSKNFFSSNNYYFSDGETESVSNDGLWGYSSYKKYSQIADAPERAVVINYCNIHSGTITVPKYLGNDLDGLYPVVGVKSEKYYYLRGYSHTDKYLPVFTGEFDQIIFSEGILFVDNLIVGTVFDDKTFQNCKTSTCNSFVIPSTLTLLEEDRYTACEEEFSCKEYIVSEANPKFKSEDGVLYEKDTKVLLKYPKLKEDLSFTIPSWVEKIVTTAGFNKNESLKTLTINENVKEIGAYFKNLKPLYAYGQRNSFAGNYTLIYNTNAYFISDFDGSKALNSLTNSSSSNITDLIIGDNVTTFTVGNSAFRYGASLYIGKNVTDMQIDSSVNRAYYNTGTILNVDISSENPIISKDNNNIIYNKQTGKMYFAAYKMSGDFTIPSYINAISGRAFESFQQLNSITIPSHVVSIGNGAFKDCTGLTKVTFSEGLKTISGSAFWGCNKLETIVIPSTVESIESATFAECDSLKTVTLLKGALKELTGFYGCIGLETISIPSTVESLGQSAFRKCTNLKNVILTEGLKVIDIGAFSECTSLKNINLPESVEVIKSAAFYNCTNLESINLPANLKELGSVENYFIETNPTLSYKAGYVFAGCSSLERIIIPNSTKMIGGCNFYKCVKLQYIKLPDSIETINKSDFNECTGLTSINLPEGLQTIDVYAFAKCSSLTSIIIPSTVTVIGDYAFQNCTNLSEVKYAVSYDLNGVEADPVERTLINATLNANGGLDGKITSEITLPAAPTNAAKTFLGWFDGSETKAAGSTCTPTRRKIVAVWEGIPPKYIITLDANGGTGTYTIEVETGKTFTFPDFTGFQKDGGFPTEWRTTAAYGSTTKSYNPGDTLTPTSDMTFYVNFVNANITISGFMGRQNYTPEYILSKENPQYGDSLQIIFEVPSKFKVSNIKYSLDRGQNYITVEHSYPVCGETITVTIDKLTYYNITFAFEVADEYVEFIFDYDKEGLEPITVGGWLNDTSFKFIAPSSIVKDGYSIKQWAKRDGSYPPVLSCDAEFIPYRNEKTPGTYYAVWQEARIINGNASVKAGGEEDLTLQEEWMIVYSDYVKKMQSGELSEEEQQALQQQIMSSDIYARYMASMYVYYNVSVSGLRKSGDVYTQCDKELLKTMAYQVTRTDGAYAVDVYEVLIRYTEAETYEYLYLKCTKGEDASGNTIYFRNESTNSKAGQYQEMIIYVCLSGKSFTIDPNGGDGESKVVTAYATREAMLPNTLKCEGKVLVGFSKNPNAKQGDDGVITAQTYKPTEDNETLYAIWRNKKKFILKNPNNLDLSVDPVCEYTNDYGSQRVDLPTNCPFEIPENYTFKGWVANIGDTNYYSGTCSEPLDLPGEEITLYAYFEENAHIILNSNNEKNISKKIYSNSNYMNFSLRDYINIFGLNGNKVIIGWSRTAGATEESDRDYNSNGYYSGPYSASDVVTLYAVWKEMTYYVTLVNTITGEEINVYNEDYSNNDSKVYLNLANYYNLFKCEGKTLIGWSTSQGGEKKYDAQSGNTWFYSETNGTKLYAIFSE